VNVSIGATPFKLAAAAKLVAGGESLRAAARSHRIGVETLRRHVSATKRRGKPRRKHLA
jgi:hypothetical protein